MNNYLDSALENQTLSDFGLKLLAHANLVLLKVLNAYENTMLKNTTKTSKVINIIVAMSENQIKQVKGLDML